MDGTLRRLTPWVLMALAGLVWFEDLLPLGAFRRSLGEHGVLRFVVGILCFYTMFLVIERQRMEQRFTQVLGQFKKFYAERNAPDGSGEVDVEKSLEAVSILIAALGSADPEVRESAESNLKRLTGQDFGTDAVAWGAWLQAAQKAAADSGGARPS